MNWIDFVLLIIILLGIVHGLIKGLILELSSLIGIVIGICTARFFYEDFAVFLKDWLDISSGYAKPLSFVVIFLAVAVLLHIVAIIIDKFVKKIALGWFNRLLGGVLGGFSCVIILSIMIYAFGIFNAKIELVSQQTIEESVLYKPVESVFPFIKPYIVNEEIID